MKNVIHIYGASGSGTTTLAKKISASLGYRFMDTDDYFWLPTDPKYTTKRNVEERLSLMKKDIEEAENVVISGSLVNWGDSLIPFFTLAVRLVTDTDLRIERLKKRERLKFGDRIMPGGDMYHIHKDFIEWANAYDAGDVNMRSKAMHDKWQTKLQCRQIVLNGADDLEENYNKVKKEIDLLFEKTFDKATEDYEDSRPEYPKELYDCIFNYKAVNKECSVLEIGCGTGKATLPFLEKGCKVEAIEPGENLAKVCRIKYEQYQNFSLINQTLQEYKSAEKKFDFIFAATSFHWIPEEYGYNRVFELLKKGGVFARFAYHAGKDKIREELALEIQEAYKTYMNVKQEPKEYGENEAKRLAEAAEKYGFNDTKYHLFSHKKDFTADQYIQLLRTYPDHMSLEENKREKLFKDIYSAINNHGGIITVYYTFDLQLAKKI